MHHDDAQALWGALPLSSWTAELSWPCRPPPRQIGSRAAWKLDDRQIAHQLRPPFKRPRGYRAAEQRREQAQVHRTVPPVLPTEGNSTPRYCCAAGFEAGLGPQRVKTRLPPERCMSASTNCGHGAVLARGSNVPKAASCITSFEHDVGALQKYFRNRETYGLRSFEIDRQLEFRGLLYG